MQADALDGIVGPFVVGTLFNSALFGITITQCYYYYTTFKEDKTIYRIAVLSLLFIDVLHTVTSCITVWLFCVKYWGMPEHLTTSPWTFALSPICVGSAAFITQSFYAWRVYVVAGRSWFLPSIILALSTIQLGFATGATAQIFILQEFAKFQSWTYGVEVWLFCASACDAIITGSLVFLLWRAKNEFSRSNTILDQIIRNTIENNLLSFVVAIVDAVLFAASSSSWHVAPQVVLTKLYFNSLLVSLNSRARIDDGTKAASYGPGGGTYASAGLGSKAFNGAASRTPVYPVQVHTTQTVVIEGDDGSWKRSPGQEKSNDLELGHMGRTDV